MAGISDNSYSSYLDSIKNGVFKRADSKENGGDGNGKVNIKEVLNDLNISSLLAGQNENDAKKIQDAAANIEQVLAQYAGADGEFTAEEYANFLNGKEWSAVLEAWHSSGQKAQLEMQWVDNINFKDGAMTKGEVKVGIMNNLFDKGIKVSTKEIEKIIDKYAGDDGTFTREEYQALKSDPKYKEFIEKYNVTPWYKSQFDLES